VKINVVFLEPRAVHDNPDEAALLQRIAAENDGTFRYEIVKSPR
jgi:hypothetical protein